MNPDTRFQKGFTELYTAAQIAKMVTRISEHFEEKSWGYSAKIFPTMTGIQLCVEVQDNIEVPKLDCFLIKNVEIYSFAIWPGTPITRNLVVTYYPK